MASQSQLQVLIDLAQRETDAAAKRLGETIRAVQDAEQKQTMLQGYRDDYQQRFLQTQAGGISPMQYRNFEAFLQKLDNAIKGQGEVVRHAQNRIETARQHWQQCERKRLSYQTLMKRAEQDRLQLAAKRDQKAMDEHATRQAFFKRP
jgi:flagellar FliJ protein